MVRYTFSERPGEDGLGSLWSVVAYVGGRSSARPGAGRCPSRRLRLRLGLRCRLSLHRARRHRDEDDHRLTGGRASRIRTGRDAKHQTRRDQVTARRRIALTKVLQEQHVDRLDLTNTVNPSIQPKHDLGIRNA